jgi:DNA invertase Pin-like site-specific DNA recombinase
VRGAKTERLGLTAALDACRAGDILVVWKLDRLGRSLAQLVATVEDLAGRSVGFRSLQEQLDTTTAGGTLIFQRPKGVDEKKRKAALALKRDSQYSIREICEIVGISRNTYYKYTRE